MFNGHGGKRNGAGRKPKAHLYQRYIAKADKLIAPKLEELIQWIERIARGEFEVVTEVWRPAALVMVERIDFHEVQIGEDQTKLVPVKSKVPAFPHKRPDDMVMVEKRIQFGMPNLAALMYLVNRIMGRPTSQPEEPEETAERPRYDLSTLSNEEIQTLEGLLEKSYSVK